MAMEIQKFTEKAQQALVSAQKAALRMNHPEVTSLHVLLALAEQEQGVVPRILDKLEFAAPPPCNRRYRPSRRA